MLIARLVKVIVRLLQKRVVACRDGDKYMAMMGVEPIEEGDR